MLASWKKSYDQPRQHSKKQRHYFANKGPSQSYGFSSSHVWMSELDIKKAEHWGIDAFELWCWRRLLRVSWTARRSNQSVLKEISPEYSLEGLILKLKLKYFGHLMQRTDSLERLWWWERLKVGGEGDDREWDSWMASLTQWTWIWVGSRSWWWTGKPGMLQSMGLKKVGHDWATELNCATPSDTFFLFWLCCAGYTILFLRPGKEPIPPAVELWNLNHRTTRHFPRGGEKEKLKVLVSQSQAPLSMEFSRQAYWSE